MNEKKEYIERGALIGAIEATEFLTMQDAATTLQLVTEAPAADVEPVVRGEWMPPETDGFKTPYDKRWTCSNCKKSDDISYRFSKFCPSCGAHMERGWIS